MLYRIIIGGLVAITMTVGCKKDAAKNPGGQGQPASVTPAANVPAASAESTTSTPTTAEASAEAGDKSSSNSEASAAVAKAADDKEAAAKAAAAKAELPEDPAAKARREMEERRKRIQEIYKLGRSKETADGDKLKVIINGDGPVYERASAIRALGREKRAGVIPDLKRLVKDKATAVQIEASIKLYQWGEHAFALPVLKGLRTKGVALRRAFQTGYEKGRATYDKNAFKFFKAGIKEDNVYVRLDSAVGLVELGKEKAGLPVIKKVLLSEEKYHIRMAAVNYMTPLKTDPKVRAMLEVATLDKDERVAKRARDVLGLGKPAAAVPADDKKADDKKADDKKVEPGPAPTK